MLDLFLRVGWTTDIVARPPGAKLRTDTLQISDQALKPCFMGRTNTLRTESREHILRDLLPLRAVELTTRRIREHAPDCMIVIWRRPRQQQDMLSGAVPGQIFPKTTNHVGRIRIEC